MHVPGSREIKALRVRCRKHICQWTGTVATLEDHVKNTCRYTLICCPNKCQRNELSFSIMRKDLEDHLQSKCPNRSYKCGYCGVEGTYVSTTTEHDQKCSKKPIPCLNKDCTLTIERGRVQDHVASECEYTIVSCKYSNIGCTAKMKRKDMKDHEEDDRVHLHFSLEKINELSIGLEELKGKKTIFVNVCNFAEKKENNVEFKSEPFFTVPNGYKMNIKVRCNGYGDGHVSVSAYLLDVPYKEKLKWPFKGTVTLELINQLQDAGHERLNLVFIDNKQARIGGGGWGYSKFVPHSKLSYNAAANTCYLVNDSLHFKVTAQEHSDRPWLQ